MMRRTRNKVDGLFIENGVWCDETDDHSGMKVFAMNHFQNLFSGHEEEDIQFLIP